MSTYRQINLKLNKKTYKSLENIWNQSIKRLGNNKTKKNKNSKVKKFSYFFKQLTTKKRKSLKIK